MDRSQIKEKSLIYFYLLLIHVADVSNDEEL